VIQGLTKDSPRIDWRLLRWVQGEQQMRKAQFRLEVVSVEEAKNILKLERLRAERKSKRKIKIVRKSKKSAARPQPQSMQSEVTSS
jgi:hypothetical protein